MVKVASPCMAPEDSLPDREASATGPYSKPVKTSTHDPFLKPIYVWVFQLAASSLGFPTKIVHASLPWMTPPPQTPIPSCFDTNFEAHCAIVSILLFLPPDILYTLFSNTFSLRSFNCIIDEGGPYLTTAHNLRH